MQRVPAQCSKTPSCRCAPGCWLHLLTSTKTNMTPLALMRHLGINYKSAWRMKHKIMQVMAEREAMRRLTGFL